MGVEACQLTFGSDKDTPAPVLAHVEFYESLDELDSLTAWLELPAGYENRTKLAKLLQPGETWKLEFGGRTIEGDVVRVRWSFSAGGSEQWIVQGLEPIHRLRRFQVSELNETAKHKIVETLVKKSKAGITAQAVGATAKELVLFDDSALGTLKALASERNFALHVEKGKVTFAPRSKKGKAVEVYFNELESIDVTADLSGMPTSVEVRGYDYLKDEEFKYKAADKDLGKVAGADTAPKLRKSAWGALDIAIEERFGSTTTSDVKDRAVGELKRAAEEFLVGELVTDLQPDAFPSTELKIAGAPWPFLGPFRIRSTMHTFGPGAGSESRIEFFSDSLPKL